MRYSVVELRTTGNRQPATRKTLLTESYEKPYCVLAT